jgi:membrane-associated PAP2 superfamily phosphatase
MDEQLVSKFFAIVQMILGLWFVLEGRNYLRGKKSFRNYPLTRDVKILNFKMGICVLIFGFELILCWGIFVFNGPAIYFQISLLLIVFSFGIMLLVAFSPKTRSLKERYGGK